MVPLEIRSLKRITNVKGKQNDTKRQDSSTTVVREKMASEQKVSSVFVALASLKWFRFLSLLLEVRLQLASSICVAGHHIYNGLCDPCLQR